MRIKFKLFALAMFVVAFASCRTDTNLVSTASTSEFGAQNLGANLDGTVTLRSWGHGYNKGKAIENARKEAVRIIIFKGLNGTGDGNIRPLLTEVNAEEKYQYYFSKFFADGGEYMDYVSSRDQNRKSGMKSKSKTQEQWGCIVTVNRVELKEKLINDGILKP